MTITEQEWFDHLHTSQLEDLKVFMKPKYFNVFSGVIDKYSDTAHFIYELLQNADDAGATEVEMKLYKDKFIFTHNGTIRFSISDPDKEEEDRRAGQLGHINSICSIGFSSKNYESEIKEIKIGKFGVGFKAVFQYTTTPEIYDYPFCFRIDNYIVPTSIDGHQYQKPDKTTFVLPFNHKEISPEKAFKEIEQKLKNLDYPQLFLHNVKTIVWTTPTDTDVISKSIEFNEVKANINFSLYALKKDSGDKHRVLILKDSVFVPGHGLHEICIGYYIDYGRINTKITPNIHCFFPTNESIYTCYVIHAPFALVDNRQQIKRDNDINKTLFKAIARLAGKSLVVLRDWNGLDKTKLLNDNILQLIKYDTRTFGDNSYYRSYRISDFFKQSYNKIFEEEPLFLARNGNYLKLNESLWAGEDILKLLDDDQLKSLLQQSSLNHEDNELVDSEEESTIEYDGGDEYNRFLGFVLCSATQREIEEVNLSIEKFDGEYFARNITSEFIKRQSLDWLYRFYDYVLRRRLVERYEINKGNQATAPMKYAQIIKNMRNEFVAPYDREDNPRIFFFEEGVTNPEVSINAELYDSSKSFREVIKALKIQAPSRLDRIRFQINQLQEKLIRDEEIEISEINESFIKVIRFYKECSYPEQDELIKLVKKSPIFLCDKNDDSDNLWLERPDGIYRDSPILRSYFMTFAEGKNNRLFFNSGSYEECINEVGEIVFHNFVNRLITKQTPNIISEVLPLTPEERDRRENYRISSKEFSSFEGLLNVLEAIEKRHGSKELSHYIWDLLVHVDPTFFKNNKSRYFYYCDRVYHWEYNSLVIALQSRRWLYLGDELKSIRENLYQEDLQAEGYCSDENLYTILGIRSAPNIQEEKQIREMSEDTREIFSLGQELRKLGITIDEIKHMKDRLSQFEKQAESDALAQREREERAQQRKLAKEQQREILKRKKSEGLKGSDFDSPDNDKARYNPETSTTGKNRNIDDILDGFEEKVKIQKEELEKVANLRSKIEQADKYSYDWLKALMDLEIQSQGQIGASGKKAIYISFDRISFSHQDDLILILSEASRYIPSSLEDMDSLPVTFVLINGSTEKCYFDSVSVKNDTLILKCGIAYRKIMDTLRDNYKFLLHAFIEVNEPIDLLKNWQSRIEALEFDADFSLKDNLRTDLEFIFGPPGTGKTTTLAKKINDLVLNCENKIRILVLAPTNKACDVLTRKLHEECGDEDGWIWRFVKTDDPYIEEEELVYDRNSEISRQKKVCVISTIARFAFDGFIDNDLRTIDWDYIFIDEASMIPLYEIIPPLYDSSTSHIIISGDPFQIEPIVNIDLWKGENIYTMVNLKNFENPTTQPYQFKVIPLMTQYRAIPKIGELFSKYLYGGKLLHKRSDKEHRLLNMGIKENPLNVISFPIDKVSIFEPKRLAKSNIQIYSVIFTVEFIKFITRNLNCNHQSEFIRLGVISPYSAEIQAIQKIYTQSTPTFDHIEVIFGSAHGFQGDQCDIIIALINPPASGLKRAADMTFVNNINILNVAISRASDYLFFLIPDKGYEHFNSLYEVKKIGRLMTSLGSSFTTSDDIEKIMFGDSQYIEANTFVTSHKITNVFHNPSTKYEVRIDENAIDIQINDSD